MKWTKLKKDSKGENLEHEKVESERLTLRQYRMDDFDAVHSYASLPNFSQYDVWGPNSEQETKEFLERSIQSWEKDPVYRFVYAVTMKPNDKAIGGCGLYREGQSSNVAFIGYSIHPDYQGKGIATELSRLLIDFGFNQLNLMVIYATCDTRNTASYKVMEKVGMSRVALIEKDKEVRGALRDSYRYEVTNPHWAKNECN